MSMSSVGSGDPCAIAAMPPTTTKRTFRFWSAATIAAGSYASSVNARLHSLADRALRGGDVPHALDALRGREAELSVDVREVRVVVHREAECEVKAARADQLPQRFERRLHGAPLPARDLRGGPADAATEFRLCDAGA